MKNTEPKEILNVFSVNSHFDSHTIATHVLKWDQAPLSTFNDIMKRANPRALKVQT